MAKKKATIKIYDDRDHEGGGSFAIVITLPSALWRRRNKIVKAIIKMLEDRTP